MKPYYEKDGIVIYHGDCREILPQLEPVDLVLTDPPYGIGAAEYKRANTKYGKSLAICKGYGIKQWDNEKVNYDLIQMSISFGKKAIIFGGNYYLVEPSSCWLVWDKENGSNRYADCELAWTNLEKAVRIFRYRWNGMLQKHMGKNKDVRFHPTQKPLELMKWCIMQADDAQTILDPFMGSGTTLRAAKDLGRKAIGIDVDERYCEIAASRLAQGVLF